MPEVVSTSSPIDIPRTLLVIQEWIDTPRASRRNREGNFVISPNIYFSSSSSTPLPSTPVVSPSSSPAVLTSTPYVPSGAGATGVPGTSGTPAGSSPVTSTQPAYNAGSANVVGAGAGLAAVFGAVALLL